jgi:hypothetical protein
MNTRRCMGAYLLQMRASGGRRSGGRRCGAGGDGAPRRQRRGGRGGLLLPRVHRADPHALLRRRGCGGCGCGCGCGCGWWPCGGRDGRGGAAGPGEGRGGLGSLRTPRRRRLRLGVRLGHRRRCGGGGAAARAQLRQARQQVVLRGVRLAAGVPGSRLVAGGRGRVDHHVGRHLRLPCPAGE